MNEEIRCSMCDALLLLPGRCSPDAEELGFEAEESPTGKAICESCLEAWQADAENDCKDCRGL